MLMLFGFRSIRISLPLPTVCEEREFTFLTVRLMLLLRLRCVVEILMFIVHWYVTNKALVMITSGIPCSDHRVESEFCSGIASLAVPNLEGKVQGRIGRVLVCKINSHIRENLHYGEVHAFSDLFASYETSQWVQSRLVKISYDRICLLESGLFDL